MQFGTGLTVGGAPGLDDAIAQATADMVGAPDLIAVFASAHHAPSFEELAAQASSASSAAFGCIADGVLAGSVEVEDDPGLAVWAAQFGDVPWTLNRLETSRVDGGLSINGWRHPEGAVGTVLIADPASFPIAGFVDQLANFGLPAIGGLARTTFGARLFEGDTVHEGGAVALTLGPGVAFSTTVSQGCRPIGKAAVVTGARGRAIYEIAGKSAFEYLREVLMGLTDEDQRLSKRGLQIGILTDEYLPEYGRGDFLIRPVMDVDEEDGFIMVGEAADVGTTVQFHVRDPASADEDLRFMLERRGVREASGGLLFTCNGRGHRFFGAPNHDAEMVAEAIRPAPLAGFFASGEIGPVAGHNRLHSYTASFLELAPQARP